MVVDIYSHFMDPLRTRLINIIEKEFHGDDISADNKKQNENIAADRFLESIKNDPLTQQRVLNALLAQQN